MLDHHVNMILFDKEEANGTVELRGGVCDINTLEPSAPFFRDPNRVSPCCMVCGPQDKSMLWYQAGCKPCLYQLLLMRPETHYLTSLSLNILFCKQRSQSSLR